MQHVANYQLGKHPQPAPAPPPPQAAAPPPAAAGARGRRGSRSRAFDARIRAPRHSTSTSIGAAYLYCARRGRASAGARGPRGRRSGRRRRRLRPRSRLVKRRRPGAPQDSADTSSRGPCGPLTTGAPAPLPAAIKGHIQPTAGLVGRRVVRHRRDHGSEEVADEGREGLRRLRLVRGGARGAHGLRRVLDLGPARCGHNRERGGSVGGAAPPTRCSRAAARPGPRAASSAR